MKKSLLLAIFGLVVVVVGAILVFEQFQSPDTQCAQPTWHTTYIGWDDEAGPCTYLQRVTFDTFYALVFPFILIWPVTLGLIGYFVWQLIIHRNLRRIAYRPILIAILALLSLWCLAMAALQLADS